MNKIRKIQKKKAQITVDKTLKWIIVISVIAVVLIFIFKANVLVYIRNLPDFTNWGMNGGGNGNGGSLPLPTESCMIIGKIGEMEGGFFKSDERYIYIDNKKTELFVDFDDNKIKLYQRSFWDIEVGIIEDNELKINGLLLDENTKSYKEFSEKGLPSVNSLKLINGSQHVSGNILCKIEQTQISPTEITEEDLINEMNLYINPRNEKGCICEDNCINYVKWIKKYSEINGFDYTWVLSLMIQESGCDYNAESPYSSYGLMQIQESSFNDNCKKSFGVTYSFDKIKVGENYVEKNIECGILILKKKYDDYNKGVKESVTYKTDYKGFRTNIVDPCINQYPKYGNYKDIDAALRAYNGWGCGSGADPEYVEKIQKIREYLINGVS